MSSSGPEAVSVVGKAEVLHDSDEGMNLASTRAVTPAVAPPCSYSSPNDLIQVRFVSSLLCGVPLPRMSPTDIENYCELVVSCCFDFWLSPAL